jgi:hypothetical protein
MLLVQPVVSLAVAPSLCVGGVHKKVLLITGVADGGVIAVDAAHNVLTGPVGRGRSNQGVD